MFYVGIFQLFLTFVSYNYNLMAKFEIFSRNYHKWFWKLCHTAKPGLEHISTIFACLALHSIVIRIKKVKVFGAIWQRSIGSRIGGKVYPRYLKNCWGVHFMHGRHKWQYTRDHNSWLLVMDQNLTDDYFEKVWSILVFPWETQIMKQMQSMQLCLFLGRQFEDTFENVQWRKVKQMQPMWLFIFTYKPFEKTFENAQWRKVKQRQPM